VAGLQTGRLERTMSEADLEYASTPEDAEYEHTDIEPAIASKFAIWLAVSMLISGAVVYGTFWLFEGREESVNRQAQLEKLDTYGWVDQSAGVVHIPIDEAMRIVSERNSMSANPQTPSGLNQVVQDSSAGRTTATR
jgi:hypothetical protein